MDHVKADVNTAIIPGPQLFEPDGTLSELTDPDFGHLTERGCRHWAAALRPLL